MNYSQSIGNRNFFDEPYQRHKGRIYTRENYEKAGYMRIGIDRDDGKGQIMIELSRSQFEFDLVMTYFERLLSEELKPAGKMNSLYAYLRWLMNNKEDESTE